jgi:hypothetical protein
VAVLVHIELPDIYDQFKELQKQTNPNGDLPPGALMFVISDGENGLRLTFIWETEEFALAFWKPKYEARGLPFPSLKFLPVHEIVQKANLSKEG